MHKCTAVKAIVTCNTGVIHVDCLVNTRVYGLANFPNFLRDKKKQAKALSCSHQEVSFAQSQFLGSAVGAQ